MKIRVDMSISMVLPKKGHFEKMSIEDRILSDRELKLDESKIWIEID